MRIKQYPGEFTNQEEKINFKKIRKCFEQGVSKALCCVSRTVPPLAPPPDFFFALPLILVKQFCSSVSHSAITKLTDS